MPQSAIFNIAALDCPEELALIERSLRGTAGLIQVAPDYLSRSLRVDYDPALIDAGSLLGAIKRAGFPAQIALPVTSLRPTGTSGDRDRRRLPATMICGGILLLSATFVWLLAGGITAPVVALAIASTLISGIPIAIAAWRAVRLRVADMNLLMTIAATGAIAIGDYFEAATAMFLFAVSLALERGSLVRAQRAIRSLVELEPQVAHRLVGWGTSSERVEDVEPESLAESDQVLVRPGERIPADAEVLSGQSAVNQAPITGESVPVEKQPGDRVFAGTLNGEGSLVLQVTRAARDSTLARIARLVDDARASRSPTERFVDAFARRYTPAVIALALCIMIVPPVLSYWGVAWASVEEPSQWVHRGLVLLVIACPCALVISTPVTVVSALYQAARSGILVKGAEFLEKAAALKCVALDKTGTVTTGAMEVVGIEALNGFSSAQVLGVAASLEQHSEHPLAVAITAAAATQSIPSAPPVSFTALRGMGVRGEVNGDTFFLGNERLFRDPQFNLSADDTSRVKSVDSSADTRAWLGTTQRLLGVIRLADRPRPGAAQAIAELRQLGVDRIVMLTGDSSAVAGAVARDIGIDVVHAELLPQDKIDRVRELAGSGPLAMVGDGVNDAPALAAADIGIALGGQASDTAMETADVVIMSPDLSKVADLIRIGRRCRVLLKQNIGFSLATKLAVMILAAAGYATMWMAVAADVGASLLVIANGLRMIRHK